MATDFDTSLRQQTTLADRVSVAGFGFWSGEDVSLEFRPALADTGIVFVREDLPGNPPVAAQVASRVNIPRRTNLSSNSVTVEMVEHVMAAFAGLQIDNCEVWASASEMPGCDGSSLPFSEAIKTAGRRLLPATRQMFKVTDPVRVGDDNTWIEARPAAQGMTVEYHLDYGETGPLRPQSTCHLVNPDTFHDSLAAARTFVLQHEANHLRSQGLGLRVTNQDLLVYGPTGPVDNHLRFGNECARHKALDIVGDLALCGFDLAGHFVAHRSGHQLNADLALQLCHLHDSQTTNQRIAS